MGLHEKSKLNRLLLAVPRKGVITSIRLQELGISRQLARKYVQNGWLQRLGVGAFARAGEDPEWLGAVYALQSQLSLTVHIGAVSALELQGKAHFVPLGQGRRVTLLSDRRENLPKWFISHEWAVAFKHRCLNLFADSPHDGVFPFECGGYRVWISAPERAILEEMSLVENNTDIEQVILLSEGLSTLRPNVLQELLEKCTSIKAKRLLLWSGERCEHTWMKRLDITKIYLGKGKRQVFKGGTLDAKYLITVPEPEGLPHV